MQAKLCIWRIFHPEHLASVMPRNPASALWRITPKTARPSISSEMHLSRWLTERYGETPVFAIEHSGARRVSGAYECSHKHSNPMPFVLSMWNG